MNQTTCQRGRTSVPAPVHNYGCLGGDKIKALEYALANYSRRSTYYSILLFSKFLPITNAEMSYPQVLEWVVSYSRLPSHSLIQMPMIDLVHCININSK